MAEVLDQNEVDALLAAVEGGEVETIEAGPSAKIFSHRRGGITEADIEVRDYDFKRPERVSKDQMRALETLHDAFSRNFGALLSGFLRTITEVKVANIEQMTFSEFTHSLPNPTCFNLVNAEPLDGNICLEISPLIIYPIIDRLLGGTNSDLFIPQRPLTAIELRLVRQIIDRAMTGLKDAWANVLELNFTLEETESNPQLVQIVPPNEVVVVVGFEMKMSGRAGTMSLCIPYNVIEPVIEKLNNQTWAAYKRNRKDEQLRHRLASQLENAKLTVSSVLADTTVKLSDVRNLSPGDLILTDKAANAPLTLVIGGRRKFIGYLGQFKGNRAFKVVRPINQKDRVQVDRVTTAPPLAPPRRNIMRDCSKCLRPAQFAPILLLQDFLQQRSSSMEREFWSWIRRAISDVDRSYRDSAYHTHSTALIVRVYLWAVLHDRPTSWACERRHWDHRTRPEDLPSQSTMSRRLRTEAVQDFLDELGRRLVGRLAPTLCLLQLVDGKPLTVAPHSKDPDAQWGRGASQLAKGYKLHVVYSGKPMPEVFEVQPLNVAESRVARRMVPRLDGPGYLVGDAGYDDDQLYQLAAEQGLRFLAPRRRPQAGLAHKSHHPDRLRGIALLETGPRVGNTFGQHLLRLRRRIETAFGNLTSFGAGLTHLPPWVRRLHRVRTYVHAKLLINAARIRANLA